MLDSDLALLYGAETRYFNRAVQRNAARFPAEFSFVLTRKEFSDLMFQIGTSKGRGGRRKLPRVFTEHGAIMAATILNSEQAVAMSVYVIREQYRMASRGGRFGEGVYSLAMSSSRWNISSAGRLPCSLMKSSS